MEVFGGVDVTEAAGEGAALFLGTFLVLEGGGVCDGHGRYFCIFVIYIYIFVRVRIVLLTTKISFLTLPIQNTSFEKYFSEAKK